LEKAGAAYTGVLLVSQIWQLYANIAVVTAWANEKGVDAGTLAERERDSPLFKLLSDFRNDSDIIALAQAGIYADVPAMRAALPAGREAYELHIAGLDRWIASIGRGAILSSKVIQVANITLIAISIYQVWKLPAIPAGGTPTPPTILGTLPGGAAVGSTVSLPSLARALEAIRRLVAIGALDGALIGGIGSLGGGPSIALPELQRPTSLSVQAPGGAAKGATKAGKEALDEATQGPAAKRDPATVGEILKDATSGNASKPGMGSNQFGKPGGMAQANRDFDRLTEGLTVKEHGGGIRSAQLSDGSTISVRPSSGQGSPTIQINPANGDNPIKIRYGQ
jgi:hypothetical protein